MNHLVQVAQWFCDHGPVHDCPDFAALAAASTDKCHSSLATLVLISYIGAVLLLLLLAIGRYGSQAIVFCLFLLVNAIGSKVVLRACRGVQLEPDSFLVQYNGTVAVLGVYVPIFLYMVRRTGDASACPTLTAPAGEHARRVLASFQEKRKAACGGRGEGPRTHVQLVIMPDARAWEHSVEFILKDRPCPHPTCIDAMTQSQSCISSNGLEREVAMHEAQNLASADTGTGLCSAGFLPIVPRSARTARGAAGRSGAGALH